MSDFGDDQSGYETTANTPRPSSTRSRRRMWDDNKSERSSSRRDRSRDRSRGRSRDRSDRDRDRDHDGDSDGENKGGESDDGGTPRSRSKKKPSRMRRFTQAALPQVRRVCVCVCVCVVLLLLLQLQLQLAACRAPRDVVCCIAATPPLLWLSPSSGCVAHTCRWWYLSFSFPHPNTESKPVLTRVVVVVVFHTPPPLPPFYLPPFNLPPPPFQVWKRAENARSQMRSSRDPTRSYLQDDLRRKIREMNSSVAEADKNLRDIGRHHRRGSRRGSHGSGGSGGDRSGFGYHDDDDWRRGGGGGDDRSHRSGRYSDDESDRSVEPDIDYTALRIDEGWLWLKDLKRGLMSGRRWRKYWCRVEQRNLCFYKQESDAVHTHLIRLNHHAEVERGDDTVQHKNRNVKYDFDIRTDEVVYHLYADEEEDSENWMDTITQVVDACIRARNAPRGRGRGDSDPWGAGVKPKLDPEEEEAARDEAIKHQAYGPGLFEATRGVTAFFTIQAYDDYDNPKTYGGEEFKVSFENDELHFDISPVDNEDGTYTVTFCPTRVGDFTLSISLNDFDIYGSPFHPIVHPAPTSGAHCVVFGDGATVADAGKTNEFTIVAKDQFDGDRGVGGDTFQVSADGPVELHPVVDNGNGRYTVRYDLSVSPAILAQSGLPTVTVHVALNNDGFAYPRPVAGTPLNPRVRLPLQTFAAAQAVSALPAEARAAAVAQARAAASPAAGAAGGGGGGGVGAAGTPVHTPSRLASLIAQQQQQQQQQQQSMFAGSPYGTPPHHPGMARVQQNMTPGGGGVGRGAGLNDTALQATLNVLRHAQAASPAMHAASPMRQASPYMVRCLLLLHRVL